jgi:hypothetical protein
MVTTLLHRTSLFFGKGIKVSESSIEYEKGVSLIVVVMGQIRRSWSILLDFSLDTTTAGRFLDF